MKLHKLRFAEFKEEHLETVLGELVRSISSGKSKVRQVDGSYPLYGSTGLIGFLEKPDYSGLKILIARVGANAGNLYKVNGEYCVTDNTLILDLQEGIDAEFLYQYLTALGLNKLVFGSGQPLITGGQLKSQKMLIPLIAEQQKIAAFLTAVDDKIQQLSNKKALLEQYKKGVMQQIFSQEIRFRDEDGEDYPDWVEHRFANVYTFKGTNSLSRECLNYISGSIKNIHYGDIHTKYQSLFRIDKEDVPFINSDVNVSKISDDNYCREGDLVITDASEDYSGIGKCIEIVSLNNEKVLAGLHNLLARPSANMIASGFSGYLMQSAKMRRQVHRIAQGSKVLSISSTRLGNLLLALPCKEEQTKIANFLSAFDYKIKYVDQQIGLTKQYKKGLLQQMFV